MRDGAVWLACKTHNLEVGGSNPSPASILIRLNSMDNDFLNRIKNLDHLRSFGASEKLIEFAKKAAIKFKIIEKPIYPEIDILCKRYKSILKRLNSKLTSEPDIQDQLSDNHLFWMLTVIENDNTQSETKKHRWLGYVQGILISKGYTTVYDEREVTRSILNGK